VTDTYPPSKQRPALLAFAAACNTRASALRRDECGDWAILGKHGHVHAAPEGYQRMIFKAGAQGWTYAKRRLSFGKVTQDGEEEGVVMLDRLPSAAEATEIRFVLGIPKRRELSEITLAALKAHGAIGRFKPVLLAFEGDRATPIAAGQ
jgi:hypothetical protein